MNFTYKRVALARSLSGLQQQVRFFAAVEDVASAASVKKLRDLSGAPLMDCKAALKNPQVQGDIQKALDWLRAKGIAKATSGNREAKEGLIGLFATPNKVSMVEINCETDFVALNKDFQNFVALVCQTIHENGSKTGEFSAQDILSLKPAKNLLDVKEYPNLSEKLGDIISSIRENIVVKRGKAIEATGKPGEGVLSTYVHGKVGGDNLPPQVQLGKVAGVLKFQLSPAQSSEQQEEFINSIGKRLSMHLVATKPLYIAKENVSQDFMDKELAIFREQFTEADKKKPKEIQEKMLNGRVSKRLSEVCLLEQNHVAEDGNPVIHKFLSQYGQGKKCQVVVADFELWSLK